MDEERRRELNSVWLTVQTTSSFSAAVELTTSRLLPLVLAQCTSNTSPSFHQVFGDGHALAGVVARSFCHAARAALSAGFPQNEGPALVLQRSDDFAKYLSVLRLVSACPGAGTVVGGAAMYHPGTYRAFATCNLASILAALHEVVLDIIGQRGMAAEENDVVMAVLRQHAALQLLRDLICGADPDAVAPLVTDLRSTEGVPIVLRTPCVILMYPVPGGAALVEVATQIVATLAAVGSVAGGWMATVTSARAVESSIVNGLVSAANVKSTACGGETSLYSVACCLECLRYVRQVTGIPVKESIDFGALLSLLIPLQKAMADSPARTKQLLDELEALAVAPRVAEVEAAPQKERQLGPRAFAAAFTSPLMKLQKMMAGAASPQGHVQQASLNLRQEVCGEDTGAPARMSSTCAAEGVTPVGGEAGVDRWVPLAGKARARPSSDQGFQRREESIQAALSAEPGAAVACAEAVECLASFLVCCSVPPVQQQCAERLFRLIERGGAGDELRVFVLESLSGSVGALDEDQLSKLFELLEGVSRSSPNFSRALLSLSKSIASGGISNGCKWRLLTFFSSFASQSHANAVAIHSSGILSSSLQWLDDMLQTIQVLPPAEATEVATTAAVFVTYMIPLWKMLLSLPTAVDIAEAENAPKRIQGAMLAARNAGLDELAVLLRNLFVHVTGKSSRFIRGMTRELLELGTGQGGQWSPRISDLLAALAAVLYSSKTGEEGVKSNGIEVCVSLLQWVQHSARLDVDVHLIGTCLTLMLPVVRFSEVGHMITASIPATLRGSRIMVQFLIDLCCSWGRSTENVTALIEYFDTVACSPSTDCTAVFPRSNVRHIGPFTVPRDAFCEFTFAFEELCRWLSDLLLSPGSREDIELATPADLSDVVVALGESLSSPIRDMSLISTILQRRHYMLVPFIANVAQRGLVEHFFVPSHCADEGELRCRVAEVVALWRAVLLSPDGEVPDPLAPDFIEFPGTGGAQGVIRVKRQSWPSADGYAVSMWVEWSTNVGRHAPPAPPRDGARDPEGSQRDDEGRRGQSVAEAEGNPMALESFAHCQISLWSMRWRDSSGLPVSVAYAINLARRVTTVTLCSNGEERSVDLPFILPDRWTQVTVTHQRGKLLSSMLCFYTDGVLVKKESVPYPAQAVAQSNPNGGGSGGGAGGLPVLSEFACSIGFSNVSREVSKYSVRVGPFQVYNVALDRAMVASLFAAPLSAHHAGKWGSLGRSVVSLTSTVLDCSAVNHLSAVNASQGLQRVESRRMLEMTPPPAGALVLSLHPQRAVFVDSGFNYLDNKEWVLLNLADPTASFVKLHGLFSEPPTQRIDPAHSLVVHGALEEWRLWLGVVCAARANAATDPESGAGLEELASDCLAVIAACAWRVDVMDLRDRSFFVELAQTITREAKGFLTAPSSVATLQRLCCVFVNADGSAVGCGSRRDGQFCGSASLSLMIGSGDFSLHGYPVLTNTVVAELVLMRWRTLVSVPITVAREMLQILKRMLHPQNPFRVVNAIRLRSVSVVNGLLYGMLREYAPVELLLPGMEIVDLLLNASYDAALLSDLTTLCAATIPVNGDEASVGTRLSSTLPSTVFSYIELVRNLVLKVMCETTTTLPPDERQSFMEVLVSAMPMSWFSVMLGRHSHPVTAALALHLFAQCHMYSETFRTRCERFNATSMLTVALRYHANQPDVLSILMHGYFGQSWNVNVCHPSLIDSSARPVEERGVRDFLALVLELVSQIAKTADTRGADPSGASSLPLWRPVPCSSYFAKEGWQLTPPRSTGVHRWRVAANVVRATSRFARRRLAPCVPPPPPLSPTRDRSSANAAHQSIAANLRLVCTVLKWITEAYRRYDYVARGLLRDNAVCHVSDYICEMLLVCFAQNDDGGTAPTLGAPVKPVPMASPDRQGSRTPAGASAELGTPPTRRVPDRTSGGELPIDASEPGCTGSFAADRGAEPAAAVMARADRTVSAHEALSSNSDDEDVGSISSEGSNSSSPFYFFKDKEVTEAMDVSMWEVEALTKGYRSCARQPHQEELYQCCTAFLQVHIEFQIMFHCTVYTLKKRIKTSRLVLLLHNALCASAISSGPRGRATEAWYGAAMCQTWMDGVVRGAESFPLSGDIGTQIAKNCVSVAQYTVDRLACGAPVSPSAVGNYLTLALQRFKCYGDTTRQLRTLFYDWVSIVSSSESTRTEVAEADALVGVLFEQRETLVEHSVASGDIIKSVTLQLLDVTLRVLTSITQVRKQSARQLGEIWKLLLNANAKSLALFTALLVDQGSRTRGRVDLLHGGFDILLPPLGDVDVFLDWFMTNRSEVEQRVGVLQVSYALSSSDSRRHHQWVGRSRKSLKRDLRKKGAREASVARVCEAQWERFVTTSTLLDQRLVSNTIPVHPQRLGLWEGVPRWRSAEQVTRQYMTLSGVVGWRGYDTQAAASSRLAELHGVPLQVYAAYPPPICLPMRSGGLDEAPTGANPLRPNASALLRTILDAGRAFPGDPQPQQPQRMYWMGNTYYLRGTESLITTLTLTKHEVVIVSCSQFTRDGDFFLAQSQPHDAAGKDLSRASVAQTVLSRFLPRMPSALTPSTKAEFRQSQYYRQLRTEGSSAEEVALVWRFPLAAVEVVHHRSFQHLPAALEFELESGDRHFLVVLDEEMVISNAAREKLRSALYAASPSIRIETASDKRSRAMAKSKRWVQGQVTNEAYLRVLNDAASRTVADLGQYLVMPWVLKDYVSDTIDVGDPASYRDLSRPMGALSAAKAAQLERRYNDWLDDTQPPFHHGTHYSTSAVVLYYLVRLQPFEQLSVRYQGGRLDKADRLFHSIAEAWDSSSGCGSGDVKELIPEFFETSCFLRNANRTDLGVRRDGVALADVELPPWSMGRPEVFVAVNRAALESDAVQQALHQWIDLIFGYKQLGEEAVAAMNVFHHLTYEKGFARAIETADGEEDRKAIVASVDNFGQTPKQLFKSPHPRRLTGPAAATPGQLQFLGGIAQLMRRSVRTRVYGGSDAPAGEITGLFYDGGTLYATTRGCVACEGCPSHSVAWDASGSCLTLLHGREEVPLSVFPCTAAYGLGDITVVCASRLGNIVCCGTSHGSVIVFAREVHEGPYGVARVLHPAPRASAPSPTTLLRLWGDGHLFVGSEGSATATMWHLTRDSAMFCHTLEMTAPPLGRRTTPTAVCRDEASKTYFVTTQRQIFQFSHSGALLCGVDTHEASTCVAASAPRRDPRPEVLAPITCAAYLAFDTYALTNALLCGHTNGVVSLWAIRTLESPAARATATIELYHTFLIASGVAVTSLATLTDPAGFAAGMASGDIGCITLPPLSDSPPDAFA